MRNPFITITTPASDTLLTTLDRIKAELAIVDVDENIDDLITSKITEASVHIANVIHMTLGEEVITETFRFDPYEVVERLVLSRRPIKAASIGTVTEDDVTVPAGEFEAELDTGILYRLDASGYRWIWQATKSIVVPYTSGYTLPASGDGYTLPAPIEAAAIELVKTFWLSRLQDPTVKSESIPGVMDQTYWIPGAGAAGLPPRVLEMIAPYIKRLV